MNYGLSTHRIHSKMYGYIRFLLNFTISMYGYIHLLFLGPKITLRSKVDISSFWRKHSSKKLDYPPILEWFSMCGWSTFFSKFSKSNTFLDPSNTFLGLSNTFLGPKIPNSPFRIHFWAPKYLNYFIFSRSSVFLKKTGRS